VHCVFLLFLERYPALMAAVEEKLQRFIMSEEERGKEKTPNIGQMLCYLLVAPKTSIEQLLDSYMAEQLDRQVFWILLNVKDLIDKKTEISPERRVEVTFKSQVLGFHILLFFRHYLQTTTRLFKTPAKLFEMFEGNFGRLPN